MMIDYEKQNEEFSKWWDDQVLDSNRWTTLERIAAQNAWMEANKRALNLHICSESFSKSDLLDLGNWFDNSPEFVEEVVNDWLNAR